MTVVTALLVSVTLASCGGGDEPAANLSEGGELAARLPADDALNIAIVDVSAVRESLGMKAGSAPPTASDADDLAFLGETGPALGILEAGRVPAPVVDGIIERASAIASVTGDRAATAISTSEDVAAFEELLRSSGLQEEDAAFVPPDGTYAIATGEGVIAVAEDAGGATAIVEETSGQLPEPLDQVDGDGQLVTLARFGAGCLDSVATSDSVGEDGEVAFFTDATPDSARIETTEGEPLQPRVVGDSARVHVAAAEDPSDEPPALQALTNLTINYDCDS